MTRIYDPIHGFIYITPLMKQFIDTEEFQRLRDLRQLGATTYIFPSANHTRFEHSIGVSHLAGLMMESLKKNGCEEITEKMIELTRIAGLLHDVGHGPFSHLYDTYVKKEDELEHEERGCNIIRSMVTRYNIEISEEDVNEIIKMICPNNENNWRYQIVANKINQLDVDKLDYIQRDCFYVGMKCAGEYSRIIKDAKVFYIGEESYICWPEKLQYEIFQVFATRYRLHKQVYNNHNVKSCEFLIINMLKKLSNFVNVLNFGDSIIYCKYVNEERFNLFRRNIPKIIGEFIFTNSIHDEKMNECIDYMEKNNINYQKVEIGFGGGKVSPLNNIMYYKDDMLIDNDPSSYSFMIPNTNKEIIIRIYCFEKEKSNDLKIHYDNLLTIYNNE